MASEMKFPVMYPEITRNLSSNTKTLNKMLGLSLIVTTLKMVAINYLNILISTISDIED